MRAQSIEVTRPCPVDLDALGVDRSGLDFHCPHCDKTVHVLSNRTEREAEALIATLQGQRACISYLRTRSGEVVFREPASIVPVGRLLARRRAAAGFALALAACAPNSPAQRLGEESTQTQRTNTETPPVPAPVPVPAPGDAATAVIAKTPPASAIAEPASPPTTAAVQPCPAPVVASPRRPAKRKSAPQKKPAPRTGPRDLELINGGAF
jgi:hypothetical protein